MGAIHAPVSSMRPALGYAGTGGANANTRRNFGVCRLYRRARPHGFIADGTCFFVRYTEDTEAFDYVVTARHLVRPHTRGIEELPLDGKVRIRLSRKNKPPRVIDTVRHEWAVHNDASIDIAVRPFDTRAIDPDEELEVSHLNITGLSTILQSPITDRFYGSVALGDDIFIPSLFTGHIGERRNIPVIRIGHIAAMPTENIRSGAPTTPAFLIETKSLGGISGAPVFVHLQPQQRRSEPKFRNAPGEDMMIVPYALIGIILGAHSGRYAEDFVVPEGEENIIPRDADFNAGISVVLPIKHAIDLIESALFKDARMATLEAIKKQSGFRHTSAHPVVAKEEYSGEEAAQRAFEAARRSFALPHKTLKDFVGTTPRAKAMARTRKAKGSPKSK